MIHRIGLFLASLVAAGVLVVALTVAGFAPGSRVLSETSATTDVSVAASGQPDAAVQPDPAVQVDTVYLAPPQKPATVTVHRVISPPGGGEHEDDGPEHESGSDD
ncbi:MAG TPA: hypothetical protein VIV06_11485 [Candidatus Limnocylindrales bacterium]